MYVLEPFYLKHIHTYTYIHIHTHTYTYIHIHTHTYTYIHIHTTTNTPIYYKYIHQPSKMEKYTYTKMEKQIGKLRNVYLKAKKYIDEKYIIPVEYNNDKVTVDIEDSKLVERLPRLLLILFNLVGKNLAFSNNWNIVRYSNLINAVDDDMILLIYGYRDTSMYDLKYSVYYLPVEKKCIIVCVDYSDCDSYVRSRDLSYQYIQNNYPSEGRYTFEEIIEIFSKYNDFPDARSFDI